MGYLWLLALLLAGQPGAAQSGTGAALRPDSLRAGRRASQLPRVGRIAWQTTPAVLLIGAGLATFGHHSAVSSRSTADEIGEHFGSFRTHVDDYLQYAPYAGLAAAALLGAPTRDDHLNTLLMALKAEVLMGATVTVLKRVTHVTRPDGSARNSFPSGHTAQAFVAATVLATELREYSPWYGVGAYTVAAGVGTLRMLNKRHWQSDVLVGAGIGILATRAAYATHRYHWGHRPGGAGASLTVTPAWLGPQGAGAALVMQF